MLCYATGAPTAREASRAAAARSLGALNTRLTLDTPLLAARNAWHSTA